LRGEIAKISEWERKRIGQDLHDSIGQQLTGMGFIADALDMELRRSASSCAELAQQISSNCRKAHQQLRDIVRGLLPVDANDNLVSSLNRLAAAFLSQTDVDLQVTSNLDTQNLDPIFANHLLLIAQEAATNAIRHGKAKHVSVLLGADPGEGFMLVEDDGTGFDFNRHQSSGSGLKIMAFRANILRGSLTIRRRVPHGMSVRCTFALPQSMISTRSVSR